MISDAVLSRKEICLLGEHQKVGGLEAANGGSDSIFYQPHELFSLIAKRIETLCGQALRTARIFSQSVCRCQDTNFGCLVPLYVNHKKIPIEVPRQEWQD
jgi:hypothetical protein